MTKVLHFTAVLTLWIGFDSVDVFATDVQKPRSQETAPGPSSNSIEQLKKKIFSENPDQRRCVSLPINVKTELPKLDQGLTTYVNDLIDGFQKSDHRALLPLFHNRVMPTSGPIKELLASQKGTLGAPLDVSVYTLWAINTGGGSTDPLSCPGAENAAMAVTPLFGYDVEIAIWLQLMGQRELGRVFAILVNSKGKWQIGALHYQQWTHTGKDYQHWFSAGKSDADTGRNPAAYVKLDIASKLLDGRDQFRLTVYDQVEDFKNRILTKDGFDKEIRAALPGWNIVTISTLLARNGAGVGVRVELPKEISANELRADCNKMGKALAQLDWFKSLDGYKCSYLLKGEEAAQEGKLGGIYVPRSDI